MFKTFCSIARLKNDTFVRILRIISEKRFWNFFKTIFNQFICELLTLLTSSKNLNKESINRWINWSWFSFHLIKKFENFHENSKTFQITLCNAWFFKANFFESRSSKNYHSLIWKSNATVRTNRAHFELC